MTHTNNTPRNSSCLQSCGINVRECFHMGQLHLSKACWGRWLSDDQPHSDYNGQWQRALCIVSVPQSSQQNPQRNKKNRKLYAIKQIKMCAEYPDMLPGPRLDLSGTPGLRPIGLSPGSWQTSLGLGSMSRYSAQIVICIARLKIMVKVVIWDATAHIMTSQ